LTAALLERLAAEPHTRLRYFCSPQHTESAFYPIIGQMERAAAFAHNDTAHTKLGKLGVLLAQSFTPPQDAALLTEMLSLPNDERYPTLELAPQQRRQKTLEALTAQVEALSRSNPILMIFEDVHWIDPTSLEALGRTVDRLKPLRVLLIIIYRPEFEPPWIGRPYVTALNINRLGDREIAAMIDSVTGNKPLSRSIRQDIIERTDGIPLFIEEMTKAVLEAGGEEAAQQTVAAIPSPSVAVPASLHASLMARLDRLGRAKEVAQIGAAIGREFSHALLAAAVDEPEVKLRSALDRLIAAGLLFRQGVPPHASYLFKHALVQDAAYGTLLREPRHALHARIAEVLETNFPEITENQPELLARHCTEAGLIEKAANLWGKAGQRSLARSALVEGIEQIKRALAQMASLPAAPMLRREQVKLQVALINPLMHVKGYAAPDTQAAVEQARLLIDNAEALGEPPEDPLLLFSVLYGFWVANYVNFDGDALRELASQFLALAEKKAATVPISVGHRLVGCAVMYTGDIAAGRAHFDCALPLDDAAEHQSLAARFGQDIGVAILSHRSIALWCLGFCEAALADADHAISHARKIGQAATLMYALYFASYAHIWCGNYGPAKEIVDELVALADEKGSAFWQAHATNARGRLLVETGGAAEAISVISSGVTAYKSTRATALLPLNMSYLAIAYAYLRKFNDGLRRIEEAMTMLRATRESWSEAEINRIAGEIALKSDEPDAAKARAYFERALSVARQQQAKSWELRAAMSMAHLWRDQGKVQQARELLAPVYGWFTEGFDTRDLKEAKALLEELAQIDRISEI
jgi:predicted ATPase